MSNMEVVTHDKPVDRARAFIRDYAKQLYGIENANALAPLVEIAFGGVTQRNGPEHVIAAARELLKYSEVPTRAIEYDSGKNGPDVEVTILGTCEIKEPKSVTDFNSEQLASEASPGEFVELPDEGRKEGS